ncbi:hydroxycinnamoyltransferase 1-like [Chenopodium quinoa]|uniref:hydroxycinnamoyltransferase 1-like n=1 Tax=Chenopodium quinoa TaxID=63459 RepID=UPI000B78FE5A|nr:hydroxycinnamoyltransferase 1-like [Chenopodium quinoa]
MRLFDGLSSFPLLLVQVTRFSCGSVCLGFAQHHHVADGASWLHFNNSWARLAKGLELDVYPVHDRANYLAPRDPPLVKFRHFEYEPSLPSLLPFKGLSSEMVTTTECTFKLTKDQMDTIKLQATSQEVTDYKLKKKGDVTCKPLWYGASKIHEAISKLNDIEYLISAIDCVESHPDLTTIIRGPHSSVCPNLTITSWTRLPCYEWGGPKFIGINGLKYDGQTYITLSSDADGRYIVVVALFTPHIGLFEKYFYNFYMIRELLHQKFKNSSI